MTEIRKVLDDPKVHFENNEDGDGFDLNTHSVGWAVSWGCQLTFGMDEDRTLRLTVAISDTTQRNGIEARTVSSGQLRDYAEKLLALAEAQETRENGAAAGCDRTRTCPAVRHLPVCLGLYRTEAEVDGGKFPSDDVLATRRSVELSTRAHARATGARYFGGGPDAA